MTGRHRKPPTVLDRIGDAVEWVRKFGVDAAARLNPQPSTVDATARIPGPVGDQPTGTDN